MLDHRSIRRIRDPLIYALIVVVSALAQRLPKRSALKLGARIGDLTYCLVKRRRRITLSNLRMALGNEQDNRVLKRIAHKSFQNMGKTLIEFLSFPKYTVTELAGSVKLEGAENLRKAMSAGRGVILVSAHLGNWELIFHIIASLTPKFSAIAQPFKYHRLNKLVNSYRTKYGGIIIEKRYAVKQSLNLLKKGFCVAIPMDQDAGRSGVFVDFFGTPASTPRGPVMLALRTGAPVLEIFDIRQKNDDHVVIISEPVELKVSGNVEEDVRANTARLANDMEIVIRKFPCQWLWMHNRWKTRPQLTDERPSASQKDKYVLPNIASEEADPRMLILSDGKPGHYNQSLGIMDNLEDVSVEIIEIRFKRKWRDDLLRIVTRCAFPLLSHNMIKGLLRWAMIDSSAKAVLSIGHLDAILSTGSSVAAPNLLLSKLIGAKAIVCTRPSPVGIKRFDLAILPEHMRPHRLIGNVTMTFGVPNRISPEVVRKAGAELSKKIDTSGRRVIGLLLGGDDPYYSIPPAMVSSLCDVLLDICREVPACLALTTSRRTDPKAEEVVKSKVLGNPSCCFSALASEHIQENPVPGILGISDVTIVTEDSFSMVCESASSGRKIAILNVGRKKKNGHPKRHRVYQLMVEHGYARRTDIPNLKDVINDLIHDTREPPALNDAQIAADAIWNLIASA